MLLIIALILLSSTVIGATIKGKIVVMDDLALGIVTGIYYVTNTGTESYITQTNSNGEFSISLPNDKYKFRFKSAGFEETDREIDLQKDTDLGLILLKPNNALIVWGDKPGQLETSTIIGIKAIAQSTFDLPPESQSKKEFSENETITIYQDAIIELEATVNKKTSPAPISGIKWYEATSLDPNRLIENEKKFATQISQENKTTTRADTQKTIILEIIISKASHYAIININPISKTGAGTTTNATQGAQSCIPIITASGTQSRQARVVAKPIFANSLQPMKPESLSCPINQHPEFGQCKPNNQTCYTTNFENHPALKNISIPITCIDSIGEHKSECSNTQVKKYSCANTNLCEAKTENCGSGQTCSEGKCISSDRYMLDLFLQKEGRQIIDMYRKSYLYPGGCADLSQAVAEALKKYNINVKIMEGTHVGDFKNKDMPHFHVFNLIEIEGVQYVLDFTKNQFTMPVKTIEENGLARLVIEDDKQGKDSVPYLAKLTDAKEYIDYKELPMGKYAICPITRNILNAVGMNEEGLEISGDVEVFKDGKEHKSCNCSYISIENKKIIINPLTGSEISVKINENNKIFDVGNNDFFEITVKGSTKVIITDRTSSDPIKSKIPLVEVFTEEQQDKTIVIVNNGVIEFDVKNTGSLVSSFVNTGFLKKQSAPMQLNVYVKNVKVRDRIISNYNELIKYTGTYVSPIALDSFGDLFYYNFTVPEKKYQELLLKKNNVDFSKSQIEGCIKITINDQTKDGLSQEATKKLFDILVRLSPHITRDSKLNLLSPEKIKQMHEQLRNAMAFVMEGKLGEIFVADDSFNLMLIDSAQSAGIFPHEYAHILTFKIIFSQLSPNDLAKASEISEKVLVGTMADSEGAPIIRAIEAKSEFVKGWLAISGDVYGSKYLHSKISLGMGVVYYYKNKDGTVDESTISDSITPRVSRYGTIGPYGLVNYHEDIGTLVGDYYVPIPRIAQLYREDPIIKRKIEYLASNGFFTQEQLKIIQNPPADGMYFWKMQSIPLVSDCIERKI